MMKINNVVAPLLVERAERAANTNKRLHQALDRFEQNCLKVIPAGSKLSLRNLAQEAGVNKDTPFSRHRRDSTLAGNYRFPEIVKRFEAIKLQIKSTASKSKSRNQIEELSNTIREYEEKFIRQCRVINQQDERIVELEKNCRELKLQNSDLRKRNLGIIKFENKAKS